MRAETPAWVEASRKLTETMKAKGMTVAYVEPPGATHSGMIADHAAGTGVLFEAHAPGGSGALALMIATSVPFARPFSGITRLSSFRFDVERRL